MRSAGNSPLDPQEAARRTTRAPQRKRFYASADVAEADGGFAIRLDGKPIRTPSGKQVMVPSREIADAIAAEWNAQSETIDPLTMPMTRFANSVVQSVIDRVEAVAEDAAKYLGSDLLFYRAGHPDALVAREAAHWDPILFWAADELGAHFILSEGIVHVAQPEAAVKAARAAFPADPVVGGGAARGDDAYRLGAIGTGARSRCPRSRADLGRCPCRRGLEHREMGRGRGSHGPPRRPAARFQCRRAHSESFESRAQAPR